MKRQQILSEYLKNTNRAKRILWGDAGDLLDINLTDAQRQTLFVIAEDDAMTVSDIARRLRVTNGAVTQLVDGLVQKGAVERRQSKQDARKVYVVLTDFGRNRLSKLAKIYEQKLADIFKDIPDDQLEVLLDAQRAVLRHGERLRS